MAVAMHRKRIMDFEMGSQPHGRGFVVGKLRGGYLMVVGNGFKREEVESVIREAGHDVVFIMVVDRVERVFGGWRERVMRMSCGSVEELVDAMRTVDEEVVFSSSESLPWNGIFSSSERGC